MTTETILTDEQITEQFEWYVDDPEHTNTFMVFARAIEQAVLQAQDREDAVATAMTLVADRYAHVMAMHLECILLNYGGPFSSDAMKTLGEYRDAMNAIHETVSPTHMGEPLIDHARRIEENK